MPLHVISLQDCEDGAPTVRIANCLLNINININSTNTNPRSPQSIELSSLGGAHYMVGVCFTVGVSLVRRHLRLSHGVPRRPVYLVLSDGGFPSPTPCPEVKRALSMALTLGKAKNRL